MRLHILEPIHTYPDRNADNIAPHAAAIARHLDGDVPSVSGAFGNMLIDRRVAS